MDKYISYLENGVGVIRIEGNEDYITGVRFYDNKEDENPNEITEKCKEELLEYFEGKRKEFSKKTMFLKGTEFQKKVWDEVYKIPYGEVRTYKDIAKAIGNEKASRAVGGAINKNPICIIVGCHRVIGTNSKLVGYAFGLSVKEKLLKLECKYKK